MLDSILSKIKQIALDKYGIRVQDHQLKKIEHEIECFAAQRDIQDLEKYLFDGVCGDQKIEDFVVDIITINESYFFRDLSLFAALKKELLPNLIERKKETVNKSIRIWSVGSSCGQEIYSISILLHEMLEDINKFAITLYGTDISNDCISLARKGEYSKFAFRSTEAEIIDKYFTESKGKLSLYTLDEKIIKSVTFENLNIADMDKQNFLWDIIICRNVFIYLTADIIKKATKFFADHLSSTGTLILGPSDFIHVKYDLVERSIGGYLCYLKDQRHQEMEEVALAANKSERHKDKRQRISDNHLIKKVQTYAQKQEQKSELLGVIRKSFGQKDYKKLLQEVIRYENRYGESSIILQYKIGALLGMGDAAGAMDYVNQALRIDRINPKLFFLKGLAQMELNMLDDAEISMRKVVAIDPCFVEAHYFLGMIFKMQMKLEKAVKKFNLLLSILEEDNNKIHYLDVSSSELREMVISEMQ